MEGSDNFRVFVCRRCGMMATAANPERASRGGGSSSSGRRSLNAMATDDRTPLPRQPLYKCKACNNITEFAELRIPYASKLLLQEIQTMSVGARFITSVSST